MASRVADVERRLVKWTDHVMAIYVSEGGYTK